MSAESRWGRIVPGMRVVRYELAEDVWAESVTQRDGSYFWAVRHAADLCLNHEGQWEIEPMPSSRDDEFLARCRFQTPEEAFKAYLEAPRAR